jgi:hypothetical protein
VPRVHVRHRSGHNDRYSVSGRRHIAPKHAATKGSAGVSFSLFTIKAYAPHLVAPDAASGRSEQLSLGPRQLVNDPGTRACRAIPKECAYTVATRRVVTILTRGKLPVSDDRYWPTPASAVPSHVDPEWKLIGTAGEPRSSRSQLRCAASTPTAAHDGTRGDRTTLHRRTTLRLIRTSPSVPAGGNLGPFRRLFGADSLRATTIALCAFGGRPPLSTHGKFRISTPR